MHLALISELIVGILALIVGFAAGAATVLATRRGGAAMIEGALGSKQLPMRHEDVLRANVKDVREGGLLHLPNFGDEFEDVDLEVEASDRYVRGRDAWHLLRGTYRNRPVGIEWREEHGETRVLAHKHLFGKTLADVGLDPARLEALEKGHTHAVDGVEYVLEDAGTAQRHEGGRGFGKDHRTWELFTADREKVLRVEQWAEEPHRASLGAAFDPSSIEIYKVKA